MIRALSPLERSRWGTCSVCSTGDRWPCRDASGAMCTVEDTHVARLNAAPESADMPMREQDLKPSGVRFGAFAVRAQCSVHEHAGSSYESNNCGCSWAVSLGTQRIACLATYEAAALYASTLAANATSALAAPIPVTFGPSKVFDAVLVQQWATASRLATLQAGFATWLEHIKHVSARGLSTGRLTPLTTFADFNRKQDVNAHG